MNSFDLRSINRAKYVELLDKIAHVGAKEKALTEGFSTDNKKEKKLFVAD